MANILPEYKEKIFKKICTISSSKWKDVLFDRSWYNRIVNNRVINFCTKEECLNFLRQCPRFEEMIINDDIKFFKY